MRKGWILYWTNVLNLVAFLGLLGTGAILEWILPPGHGGGGGGGGGGFGRGRGGGGEGAREAAAFLSQSRHEWGEIHFWIAISMVALMALHLLLHTNWIVQMTKRLFVSPKRPAKGVPAPA